MGRTQGMNLLRVLAAVMALALGGCFQGATAPDAGAPAMVGETGAPDPLTEREVDIVRLVAQGLSNRQIADQLVIGEATVRTHVGNVLNKLQLANRVQATLYALREGLTSLDEIDDLNKE